MRSPLVVCCVAACVTPSARCTAASVNVAGRDNVTIVENSGAITINVTGQPAIEYSNRFNLKLDEIGKFVQIELADARRENAELHAMIQQVVERQESQYQNLQRIKISIHAVESNVRLGLGELEAQQHVLDGLRNELSAASATQDGQHTFVMNAIARLQERCNLIDSAIVWTLRREQAERRVEHYGYAITAGGTLALGVAGYLAIAARAQYEDADKWCDHEYCDPAGIQQRHKAVKLGNAATGFLIGGSTLAVTGVATLLGARLWAGVDTPKTSKQLDTSCNGIGVKIGGNW